MEPQVFGFSTKYNRGLRANCMSLKKFKKTENMEKSESISAINGVIN